MQFQEMRVEGAVGLLNISPPIRTARTNTDRGSPNPSAKAPLQPAKPDPRFPMERTKKAAPLRAAFHY